MALPLVLRRLILQLGVATAFVACLTSTGRAALPSGNVVQQWNTIAENIVVGSGAFQNEGLIYMAYVSAAVYDAVAAIEDGYASYAPPIEAPSGASVEAAVVEAAYRTLRYYLPAQAGALDALYAEALAAIPDSPTKQRGLEVGLAAASQLITLRIDDGRSTPIATTSPVQFPEPAPGVWRRTPPYGAPQTPWVGSVKPFVLNNVQQFHPAPPPPLSSRRWAVQFEEVKEYGGATDSARTTEQTAIARFWTANVIRQYNLLGREIATNESLNLLETARLLAMINIVGADAQIAVMHWKYEFLFWRPVTAIDPTSVTTDHFSEVPGFDDGNTATAEEVGWRPLVATPNHPEYPAAHGSITGAIAEVLTEFFGSEQINVAIHGFDPTGAAGNLAATRYFATADQLVEEIVNARLWAGLHYRSSTEAGVKLGEKVAHFDLRHAFTREH